MLTEEWGSVVASVVSQHTLAPAEVCLVACGASFCHPALCSSPAEGIPDRENTWLPALTGDGCVASHGAEC